MSLRTSLKRGRSQVPGLDAGTEKKAQKKKKDEKSKRKELPPLADEGPFVPLHRLFGYDKHKTLRPLEIVERRRTPALSGEIGAYDPEEQLLALAAQRGVHPYEYYVHFLELNRRNDCWLKFEKLQITDDSGQFAPTEEIEANAAVKVHRVTEDQEVKVEFLEEAGINSNEGMDEQGLREHEEVTKVKNVEMIELGRHRIETWYFSPFPRECFPDREQKNPIPILYLCEFTLRFFRHKKELRRHYAKNPIRHPPGNEIYRDPESRLAMFEIDGFEQKEYCQNLCWLAKLFLDHKTLFFDVDPFLFYVLCEYDERGYHIVGYYSKEKESESGYNLACILIIPAYQRKGYGKFLIEFSYALSKIECKVGSPEKPLSDLGQLGYNSFWSEVILRLLSDKQKSGEQLSIYQICAKTSFKPEDVISTLKRLKLLQYWNGQHVILYTNAAKQEHQKYEKKRRNSKTRVKEDLIHWTPLELEHQRRDKNKIGRWHISSKISGNVGDDAGDRD